jgi:hypothetical protein
MLGIGSEGVINEYYQYKRFADDVSRIRITMSAIRPLLTVIHLAQFHISCFAEL